MKSHTNKPVFKLKGLTLFCVTVFVLSCASGGLLHVYAKNREVQIARKIDEAKRDIATYKEDLAVINVRIDRKLDRYLMKEELLAQGSELRETHPSQFEQVRERSKAMLVTKNP